MTSLSRRAARRSAAYSWFAVSLVLATVLGVLLAMNSTAGAAVTPVGLGTASSFAVMAGTTVTNTGRSRISGDVGVSPGTAVTGFPPGVVTGGTIQAATTVAAIAQSDLTTAYNTAAGETPATSVPMFIGAGQTFGPGVYNSASSLEIGGSLTLNAHGDPAAMFVFQAGSTLLTDTGSSINFTNGASACNVFFQVGSSATLQTGSTFQGNILALTSITVNAGATIFGRALAQTGAVTLNDDTITAPACGPSPSPSSTSASPTPTSPSPSASSASPTPSPSHKRPGPTPKPTHKRPGPTPAPSRRRPAPGPSPAPGPGGPSPSPVPGPSPSPSPSPTLVRSTVPVTG